MVRQELLTPITPQEYGHYIAGKWVASSKGETFDGLDPTTAAPWYKFAQGTPEDVDKAVRAARDALTSPEWRDMTQTQRGRLLRRLGDLIAEQAEDLGRIETRDNGKLLRETTRQVRRVPEFFYYYAGLADKIHGDVIPGAKPDILNYTIREPIGVVGAIVPWNSPLQLAAMKIAPALACGNTMIVKPSEHASASLLEVMPLFDEAGFPSGVVNLVTGAGETGAALTNHRGVDKIAFTGGTHSGREVAKSAASHFARTTLELGGKSPQLVFSDADPANAAMGIMSGIFSAGGQTCVAGSRAFVHADLYDEICEMIVERAKAVKLGNPMDEKTELGPLALEAQRDRVEHYVKAGVSESANLRAGGKRPTEPQHGWFFEPTVFTEIQNDMTLAREEIFGPVLGIGRFEDDDEAIELANDTPYGLAAGIWTRDLTRAHTVARRLDAGTVWINTYRSLSPLSPFGGFKDSGIGKENGTEVIYEYTRLKSIWVNLSSEPIGDPFVGR